jgi:hypothetical protein
MKAPFESAPTDAPQTLAKQRELLQKGGLAEHLSVGRAATSRFFLGSLPALIFHLAC